MGTLATADADVVAKYGVLAGRFNTLREFYNCVRVQVNSHKTLENCFAAD